MPRKIGTQKGYVFRRGPSWLLSRNGTPLDARNISNRVFLPLAKKLGFPVTWHAFRRAHSSFAGQLDGVALEDRVAMMGHTDAHMTLAYSVADVERRRQVPTEILKRLETQGGVQ